MVKKDTRITVRLTEEANLKLKEAHNKGYSTSQFINEVLSKSVTSDIGLKRKIMLYICKMQSELEFEQDPEIKRNLREELHQLCLVLESSQSPI